MENERLRRRLIFLSIFLFAAVVRLLLLLLLPPGSDVYYYDAQAAQVVLQGGSPYLHAYVGIPPALATPGAERVFAYLPVTALFLAPFQLAGDVRLGFVFAGLAVGCAIYAMGGRRSLPSSALYLLLPATLLFSTVYLDDALPAILFLALSLLLEGSGRRYLSSASLGVSLATIQLTWLVIPFFVVYHVRNGRWRTPLVSLAVFTAIALPFFLASPSEFVREVLLFQFGRDVLPLVSLGGPFGFSVNPSLAGLLGAARLTDTLPLRLAILGASLLVALSGVRDLRSLLLRSSLFVLLSVFVLPGDFFWAYAEMPLVILLLWVSRR